MEAALWVALGGAIGSVVRLGIGRLWVLPWGTLAANVAACLLLGVLTARLRGTAAPDAQTWHLLVGIGFCGGLSTFSTLVLELVQLGQRNAWGAGLGYLAASLGLGIGALLVGLWLGR